MLEKDLEITIENNQGSYSPTESKLITIFQSLLGNKNLLPKECTHGLIEDVIDWGRARAEFKTSGYNRDVICRHEPLNEVVLACWLKNQVTPIHNHPNISCWIYVIKGEIQETLIPQNLIENEDLDNLAGSSCWGTYCQKQDINTVKSSHLSQNFKSKIMREGDWSYIDDTKGVHHMLALTDEVVTLHFYRSL